MIQRRLTAPILTLLLLLLLCLVGRAGAAPNDETRRAAMAAALKSTMGPPVPRSIGRLIDDYPQKPEMQAGDKSRCKPLDDLIGRGDSASPELTRECLRLRTASGEQEAALTVRTGANSEVRIFAADGTEHGVLVREIPYGRVVIALVPQDKVALVAVRHKGSPDVHRSVPIHRSWRAEIVYPQAAMPPVLVRLPRFGCRTLELRGAKGRRVYIDGVEVMPTWTRSASARSIRLFFDLGDHEVQLVPEDGTPLTWSFEVNDPEIARCETELLDLRNSDTVGLVKMEMASSCAEMGIDSSAVVRAAGGFINTIKRAEAEHAEAQRSQPTTRFKGVFKDLRQVASVLGALGTVDRSLAPKGSSTGPLSWNRPVDDVARSLYGKGIQDALALGVDCARRGGSSSITVTAVRVDTKKAWEGDTSEDLVKIGSHTVNGLSELRTAVRVALSRSFGWPSMWIRPPFVQRHYGKTSLNLALDVPDDTCTSPSAADSQKQACTIWVKYAPDDGYLCDAIGQSRMLVTDASESTPPKAVAAERLVWDGRDEQQLSFRPPGGGRYWVQVLLVKGPPIKDDKDNKHWNEIAWDTRCVHLDAPQWWWRVDAGAGFHLANWGAATSATRGSLEASLMLEGTGGIWNGGGFLGYAYTSIRASVPPDWDDLAGSAHLYRKGELPLSWQRHSLRAGPFMQLFLEPSQWHADVPPWYHNFIELRPAFSLSLLYLRDVPPELVTLRGGQDGDVVFDLDVDITLKLTIIGARLPTERHVNVGLSTVLDVLSVDDLFDTEDRSVTRSSAIALGLEAVWGLGL